MAFQKPWDWSRAQSDECWEGDGYCDGYVPDGEYADEECGCSCHNSGYLNTMEEVIAFHKALQRWK